jgi:hypothetical protein
MKSQVKHKIRIEIQLTQIIMVRIITINITIWCVKKNLKTDKIFSDTVCNELSINKQASDFL